MTFKNSYWNSESVYELYEAENPERELIQPIIAELVNELSPARLLDFGCGDAYVERLLKPGIQVDLFDKNEKALDTEFGRLNRDNCRLVSDEKELPIHHYDCALLSFVLVCVESRFEQKEIFRILKHVVKESGTLIVVNSHPCFLQYDFAAFQTSHQPDSFNYLREGVPYSVTINQPNNKPRISFQDYHWTLSFWINTAIESGFELQRVIEVPDGDYKDLKGNPNFPPFIVMMFTSHGDTYDA